MIRGLSAKGRNSLVGVGAIAVLALSSPADAEDTRAIEAQLKVLQAQISALQKEVEKAKAAAASVKASAEKSNSGDLESDIDGGLMNGANLDTGATIKGFGARAQVDW